MPGHYFLDENANTQGELPPPPPNFDPDLDELDVSDATPALNRKETASDTESPLKWQDALAALSLVIASRRRRPGPVAAGSNVKGITRSVGSPFAGRTQQRRGGRRGSSLAALLQGR